VLMYLDASAQNRLRNWSILTASSIFPLQNSLGVYTASLAPGPLSQFLGVLYEAIRVNPSFVMIGSECSAASASRRSSHS